MISPEDIRGKALRFWESARPLRAELGGEAAFPWTIAFARPSSEDGLRNFGELREELSRLREESRSVRGFGYTVEWREVNTRTLGAQAFPETIRFDSIEDLCRFIGREKDLKLWRSWCPRLIAAHPPLREWISRRPLRVIAECPNWPGILAVLAYFSARPRPGIYLRQLDIPGVDTKFIERNHPLLRELLDQLLGLTEDSEAGTSLSRFERRFGLRRDEPLLRYRDLDRESSAKTGFADVSVPLPTLARCEPACARVFITENKVNGLCFPECPGSLVFFGLGYGLSTLREVGWLLHKEVWYWGDLDTHGFAMLDRLRGFLPQARSFLMDRETLERSRPFWGQEPDESRFLGELARLSAAELELFNDLKRDRIAPRLRLEQERIPFSRVEEALAGVIGGSHPP